MGLVAHKGEMPFPLWYSAEHRVGHGGVGQPGNVGAWIDPRLRKDPAGHNWGVHGYDAHGAKLRRDRQHRPVEFWEWSEEELREEELHGIERLMETPPVPLSQIGRRRARSGSEFVRWVRDGGW